MPYIIYLSFVNQRSQYDNWLKNIVNTVINKHISGAIYVLVSHTKISQSVYEHDVTGVNCPIALFDFIHMSSLQRVFM